MKILASSNKHYYAYPIDNLRDLVEEYIDNDQDEDAIPWSWVFYVEEPIYYAYIAHSDMTEIDVAFVSSSETKVDNLDMNSHIVQLFLGGDDYRTEYGFSSLDYDEGYDKILDYLKTKGIDILDSESETLDYVGKAVLLSDNICKYIDEIIEIYDTTDSDEVYRHLIHDYCDRIIDDLYTNSETNIMIVPVKKQHWGF